jgi:hypothetical protein
MPTNLAKGNKHCMPKTPARNTQARSPGKNNSRPKNPVVIAFLAGQAAPLKSKKRAPLLVFSRPQILTWRHVFHFYPTGTFKTPQQTLFPIHPKHHSKPLWPKVILQWAVHSATEMEKRHDRFSPFKLSPIRTVYDPYGGASKVE